ncbi:MAG: hypothetical protein KC492_26020, partial [Myxococcales bacterium]|nr:hypothetical protein [Myxococcales bacterium]
RAFFEPTPAEVAVRRTPRMARFAASSGSSRLSSIDDLVSSWLIRELPDELSRLLLGRIALAAWSTRSTGLTPSSVAMIDPELSDCLLSEDGLRCIATLVQRGFIRVTGDVYAVAIDDVLEHLVGRIAVRELLGMGVDKLLEELRGRNAPALAAGTARAIGRIAIEDKRDLECLATRLASSMDSVSLRDIELLCQGISSVKSSDASCWILSVWSLRPKFALTRNRRQAIRAQEDILIRLAAYHGEETILTEALLGSPHLRDHAAAQLAISSRHRFRAVGTVLDGSVARVHWRRPWTLAPAVAVAFCLFATLMFVEPRARGEYLRIARQLGVNLGVLGAGSRLRSGILAFVVGSVLPRLDAWPQGPVPMLSEFKRLFDGGSGNRACLRPIQRLYEGTVGPNEVEDTIRALATDLSMAPMLVAERAMLSVLSGKWAQDMLDVAQRVGDQVLPANGDDPMILTPPTMGGQSMLYVYWSYLQNNPPSTPGWIDRYEEFRLLHDRWLLHIGHAQWHYRYCSATPGARHKSIYLVPRLVLGSKAGDETRMLVLHELWRRSEFDDQLVLDLLDEIRIVAVGEHEVSMALDALEPLFVSGADRWKHRPILRRCVSQLIAELLVRDELSTRQALRRHGLGSLLNGLPGPRPMEELGYALYLATDRRLAMEAERGSALHLFLELVLSQVFEARSFREYVNWLIQALVRALEERG